MVLIDPATATAETKRNETNPGPIIPRALVYTNKTNKKNTLPTKNAKKKQ